ncbi:hypothetical protein [Micromonospora sp. NPDC050200]|uniref:hypothetical protein n=1 Tax=Micromonospora sp. NPDC050200 TaxID=3155664 RepID=UPI0033EFD916
MPAVRPAAHRPGRRAHGRADWDAQRRRLNGGRHVQTKYAATLLDSGDGRGIGYLLKDRIADVPGFVDNLRTVVDGGSNIMTNLGLLPSDDSNRLVLAALTYLAGTSAS